MGCGSTHTTRNKNARRGVGDDAPDDARGFRVFRVLDDAQRIPQMMPGGRHGGQKLTPPPETRTASRVGGDVWWTMWRTAGRSGGWLVRND